MTRMEWLAYLASPREMLDWVSPRASERRLRLFGAACCRHVWHLLDDRSRSAVAAAEEFTDGHLTSARLGMARRGAVAATTRAARTLQHQHSRDWGAEQRLLTARAAAALSKPWGMREAAAEALAAASNPREAGWWQPLTALLRDVFGDPFCPPSLTPAWLAWNDATVIRLTQVIYEERRFEEMPILADALEDAGCANPDLLTHCRSGEAHVRGCWAVDALLGKS